MKTLLLSKGFVVGLLVLLINDFFLKGFFGNWVTGKLSDFAGLFIFPMFLTALFPKAIRFNYIFTVLFFLFWKTGLSQPFINYINTLGFPASRVVDYTDFIAFVVLPPSYRYCTRQQNAVPTAFYQKIITYLIGVTAFVAFSATTVAHRVYEGFTIDKTYKSSLAPAALLDSINAMGIRLTKDTVSNDGAIDTLYIAHLNTTNKNPTADSLQIEELHFKLTKRRKGSKINLVFIRTGKRFEPYTVYKQNRKVAQQMAEKLMIEPLR
jgi:hypothetical protein